MEWRCNNCKEQFVLGECGGGVNNFRGKGVCDECYRHLERFSDFGEKEFKELWTALGFKPFWKD